jgi:hypothetical protein
MEKDPDNLGFHIAVGERRSKKQSLQPGPDHGTVFATNPDASPATPARPMITHLAPLAQATRPSKGK